MQEKLWLEARIKIQQLPNSYLRFPRVTSPTRDRVGYAFIEAEQPIFRRSQRSQIPEGLRPAVNFVRRANILSAYLFARRGVQLRWGHRLESLCSSCRVSTANALNRFNTSPL